MFEDLGKIIGAIQANIGRYWMEQFAGQKKTAGFKTKAAELGLELTEKIAEQLRLFVERAQAGEGILRASPIRFAFLRSILIDRLLRGFSFLLGTKKISPHF